MSKKSQQDWIDGAVAALGQGGVEAVRIEPLAQQLGVSKGSFYHHFKNRRALLLAVLDQWEKLGTNAIIDAVDSASEDPAQRLHALVRLSCSPSAVGDSIESSIRAWAQNDDLAKEAAARVDRRRIGYVSEILSAAGLDPERAARRARLLYRVVIGDTAWRLAGGPQHSETEFDELVQLLLSETLER